MSASQIGEATVGVDLGGTGTRIVRLEPDGTLSWQVSVPTAHTSATEALELLASELTKGAELGPVAGIGIGASGPISSGGVIDNDATLPAYSGYDICAALREQTGWPCIMDNDAATAALGEYHYGAGRGASTVMTVTLGTGVGVGVVTAGGRLVRALDGSHPEAGHIAVPDAPVPCYCGLPRCWEQAASRKALHALLGADAARAGARARSGDVFAQDAFERFGEQVAPGLGTLLTIFHPERVVLGGSVAQCLDLFGPAMRRSLRRQQPYQCQPDVVEAALGDLAGAVGAATLARNELDKAP